MARRTDIVNHAGAPAMLDLRDWDLDPRAVLEEPLDLSRASTALEDAETVAFFEALPMNAADPMIVPTELVAPVPDETSPHLRRVALVLLIVAIIGFVAWAVIKQLHVG